MKSLAALSDQGLQNLHRRKRKIYQISTTDKKKHNHTEYNVPSKLPCKVGRNCSTFEKKNNYDMQKGKGKCTSV